MSFPGISRIVFLSLTIFLVCSAFLTSSGEAGRPPRLIETPADSVVPKNEPATLNCRADGDPPPEISWIKDGKPIRGDQRGLRNLLPSGSLLFLRVRKDQDAGVYACVARNTFGEVTSRNATLDVATLRDEFRASPQNTWVAQGDTAILECEPPRGNPEPKVSWKKNGNPIDVKANGRYRLVGQGSLSISQIRQSDEGRYVCSAKNIVGTRQSNTALLRVTLRPQFTIRPANTSALLGSDVSLSCVARGDPPPEITWKKQGGALPLKRVHFDEERFLISNVSEQDAGIYICVAENKAGSITSSASVDVLPLPRFTLVPQNVEIQPNTTAFLGCSGVGSPPPTLFWSKEGGHSVIFQGSGIDNVRVSDEGTLQIDNVSERDEGFYFCAAVSQAGSVIHRVQLKVTPVEDLPPPIISVGPSNQTRPMGSTAVMACIADGNPPPVITWYKNGNSFLLNHRIFTDDAGTLRINELEKGDSGVYECVASSRSGKYVWKAYLTVDDTLPNNPFLRSSFDLLGSPKPRPPEPLKPEIIRVDTSSVTIAWHPRYFVNNEYDFSKEGGSPVLQFSKGISNPSLVLSSTSHKTNYGRTDDDDSNDDEDDKTRREDEESESKRSNGQTNSRNGHRHLSAFIREEGINTIRKLNSGLSSSAAKSISFNEDSEDDDDDEGSDHHPPSSPVYIDDDEPSFTLKSKRSIARVTSHGKNDFDFDTLSDKSHTATSKGKEAEGESHFFQDNLAPEGVEHSIAHFDHHHQAKRDTFKPLHSKDGNFYETHMAQTTFDGSWESPADESDDLARSDGDNGFLRDQEGGGEDDFYSSPLADSSHTTKDSRSGGRNGFDDIVSQIIARDQVKDEYDNEEEDDDYEDEKDDDEEGSRNPHNLIIQSTKKDPPPTKSGRIISISKIVPTTTTTTTTTTASTTTTTSTSTASPLPTPATASPASNTISRGSSLVLQSNNNNNNAQNNGNANTDQLTYKVEYYSADEVKTEWLLGATDVPVETFTLKYLKPNTEYIFFVRSVSPEGIVSPPSPLSESVRTTLSGSRSTDLAREKLSKGIVVILKNVYPTSSTSLRIEWQIVSATEFVEGFYIYYRRMEQKKTDEGSYQMLTVLNAGAATFQIVGLDKFTAYQVFLLPFFKNVEGRPSNYVNVTTLQDVPSAAPELIDPAPVNNSAVVIRWKPPPAAHHNGIILGYQLRVWQGQSLVGNKTVDGLTNSLVLNNLTPGQSYSLQIGSYTSRGVGVFSSMRTLHFRPDNQMSNSINPYNPESPSGTDDKATSGSNKNKNINSIINENNSGSIGGDISYPNNHATSYNTNINNKKTTNNNLNFGPSSDDRGSVEDNLIRASDGSNSNNNEFVTSNGIAFGGARAGRHDVFTEAWFIALIGSVIFAMMLVFIFALYLRRCQLRADNDKLKVSTTEIPDGSIPPHYPDDNLWIDSSTQKQLSLKSVKTNEMNEYENANNYAVVEERHSPIAYASTTLVNGGSEKHKSSFSVFGESTGMNGLGGHGHGGYDQRSPRDFSMLVAGMGASPKIVGWAATTSSAAMSQPNNKTGSLNMCSQDMKKPPWLMPSSSPPPTAGSNASSTNPFSSHSSSSAHSSASSEALMKLNLKPKIKLKTTSGTNGTSNSDKLRKVKAKKVRRPSSSRGGPRTDFYGDEDDAGNEFLGMLDMEGQGKEEYCPDDRFNSTNSQELGKGTSLNVLTTFQTPLPGRKHLIVDFNNGQSITSSILQSRLNAGVGSVGDCGNNGRAFGYSGHPPPPPPMNSHNHNGNHNPF